mmetsp:Transcript_7197/g.26455  ORF Transcript_7197/g.26455 Transcript_7197/m.26455 type:complete len:654 (+) Transcript_7197:235-2196(+)
MSEEAELEQRDDFSSKEQTIRSILSFLRDNDMHRAERALLVDLSLQRHLLQEDDFNPSDNDRDSEADASKAQALGLDRYFESAVNLRQAEDEEQPQRGEAEAYETVSGFGFVRKLVADQETFVLTELNADESSDNSEDGASQDSGSLRENASEQGELSPEDPRAHVCGRGDARSECSLEDLVHDTAPEPQDTSLHAAGASPSGAVVDGPDMSTAGAEEDADSGGFRFSPEAFSGSQSGPNRRNLRDMWLGNETANETERARCTRKTEGSQLHVAPPVYPEERSKSQSRCRDQEGREEEIEVFNLKIIHRRMRTGFEESKEFEVEIGSVIACRYQVVDYLGSAAFSKALECLDLQTGTPVCVKIIKNNKDFFDQSLDEIKLLKLANANDPGDENHILRLYDYFYYKEHLILVCELLRANLYEFQKFNRESGGEVFFTEGRLQRIARQILEALAYLHSLMLIHCDLKPENILVSSYRNAEVKVIDLGSSCFVTDHLSSYVQSRSYRAPEVILGLPYDQKIDIWSLGCILAELFSGFVLFHNESVASLLARVEAIVGPVPEGMKEAGTCAHKFYTRGGKLFERDEGSELYYYLDPLESSLEEQLPGADGHFVAFLRSLLQVDPHERPTAEQALQHPWLTEVEYPYSEWVQADSERA